MTNEEKIEFLSTIKKINKMLYNIQKLRLETNKDYMEYIFFLVNYKIELEFFGTLLFGEPIPNNEICSYILIYCTFYEKIMARINNAKNKRGRKWLK